MQAFMLEPSLFFLVHRRQCLPSDSHPQDFLQRSVNAFQLSLARKVGSSVHRLEAVSQGICYGKISVR